MTVKERKQAIQEKLTLESLEENTTVFRVDQIGAPNLDQYTVDVVKKNYKLWFDTWVKDELKELLK